ncbi:hypothetical protein P389DRAFT_90463 [Cystobasidium minutum MCA 4210]|uniref:uncharacterized protein n=1 Tax=Cystobasidium minutum MCA 4210 TaxID=1397322 RepID=UPI0034CEE94F|eukprot:jgi/Rhomi1/90463/CE90462_398
MCQRHRTSQRPVTRVNNLRRGGHLRLRHPCIFWTERDRVNELSVVSKIRRLYGWIRDKRVSMRRWLVLADQRYMHSLTCQFYLGPSLPATIAVQTLGGLKRKQGGIRLVIDNVHFHTPH